MKKFLLILVSLLFFPTHTLYKPYDHLKSGATELALGAALLATALYSTGQTLLDCGYGYYELKKEYIRYLLELEALEQTEYQILTPTEKHFWALNQAISKIPRVFWRECVAGSFSIFTAALAYKYLNRSLHHLSHCA